MRKLVGILAVSGLLAGAVGGTAVATKPPWAGKGKPPHAGKASRPAPTKMRFKLTDHQVAVEEAVEGNVRLLSGRGRNREPLAGASLRILVDGIEIGTVTTDVAGRAQIGHVAALEGDHVMKVLFAGDAQHRRAKRAQGFEVGGAVAENDPEEA